MIKDTKNNKSLNDKSSTDKSNKSSTDKSNKSSTDKSKKSSNNKSNKSSNNKSNKSSNKSSNNKSNKSSNNKSLNNKSSTDKSKKSSNNKSKKSSNNKSSNNKSKKSSNKSSTDKSKKSSNNKSLTDKSKKSSNKSSNSIKDIYNDVEKFGFTFDIPNETPFSINSYKKKCKSVKGKVIYKEPKINKKAFGFLLPKLNRSLYVGRQQKHLCYNTNKKNIERRQLELGKTCYNDKECKSEKCSNIKLFRLPGKCVPALSKSAFR